MQPRRRAALRTTPQADTVASQRRHRPDYHIIGLMSLLMMIGLVVMYAIGPARANVMNLQFGTDFYTSTYFVFKQMLSMAIAIIGFSVMAFVPFKSLIKHSWLFVKIGFGACLLLFVMGNILHIDAIATATLGAYRWFNLGPLGGLQPAEILKLALLIYIAGFLGRRYYEGKINDLHATIIPVGVLSAVALFMVVVLQKDMGTGLAMASTIVAMFVVSTMRWKILGIIAAACVVVGMLAIFTSPHRVQRVVTFFEGGSHATSEVNDGNYQIKNAMIALGSGGMFGRGIGSSIQATGYLPEATNDSIFAIIGEIFGFIGVTVILGLFAGLLIRLLRISDHLADMPMRLAVAGVFGWLVAHVIMNIGSMIGLVPLTGITLPLLSFGGTSMVFMTAALGLAFQLSRYTAHQPTTVKELGHEDSHSRRRVGRTRYASRRSN